MGFIINPFIEFPSTAFLTATGGTISTNGNYKVHRFTSNGTFEVTELGGVSGKFGGGGGAGGLRTNFGGTGLSVDESSYAVTVGAGGAISGTGSNSVFSSITSTGGGYGGDSDQAGGNGGSGGGGGKVNGAAGSGNTPSTTPAQGWGSRWWRRR